MALAMVPDFMAQADRLSEPLYLAFTFDEEIGCFGAERMPAFLKSCNATPRLAVIGEPTGMKPINGHKGGMELMTRIKGVAGHASRPSNGVNAVHAAARLISFIEELAAEYAANPVSDHLDPPCSTLSVGRQCGSARNIIAGDCRLDLEIRALPGDDHDIHSRGWTSSTRICVPQ